MISTSEITVTRPNVYESKRILLTSPMIHIGSAVSQLSPFEYVQTSNRVYLPNSDALARRLKQRGALNRYIDAIERRQEITSILKDVFGEDWHTATTEEGNPIFPQGQSSLKWTEDRITDLRPMIRNGFGQLYIPGSSIKGAIRTAIAYHLLKHRERYNLPPENQVSAIEQRLRESMGSLKTQAKSVDDKLFMNQFFHSFDLIGKSEVAIGPNTDFMRAVQITDSTPLQEARKKTKEGKTVFSNLAVVPEVLVSSHFPDDKAKYRASIYAEMVRSLRTEFTISLDTTLLSWFRHQKGMQIPFQSVEGLLKICQEFAQDQWDNERVYWQAIANNPRDRNRPLDFTSIRTLYEPERCPFNLRIGWASGMTGTTVGLLFQDDLRAEIRDACGIPAPGFEAPKSRRTVMTKSGEIKFVPGWVKFQVCS